VALIAEANRRIWQRSLDDPETAGMGTTVTAALVDIGSGTVAIGHVGDSRAYRLRGGQLEQLTVDHSLVAELVQSGILTPEEAERHPQRSAITRALGTEPTVEVDAFTVDAAPGDLYLVCSDGLSAMLSDEELEQVLASADGDIERMADELVRAANARGGEDNITVVLFELLADADAPVAAEGPVPDTDEEAATPAAAAPPEVAAEAPQDEDMTRASASEPSLSRHGAGPGGRVAALLLILAVLAVVALVLFWSLSR